MNLNLVLRADTRRAPPRLGWEVSARAADGLRSHSKIETSVASGPNESPKGGGGLRRHVEGPMDLRSAKQVSFGEPECYARPPEGGSIWQSEVRLKRASGAAETRRRSSGP